ncbi:hypothetical protein GUJ93_ZPchr0014g47659 [Zizania palustris]|uniref:Uncharacterized protein n=1 Tax=Zizania palustris TaxID=103762 RepID=A0A8J5TAR5_ZIZPA|nr:hypothetical protein GUJ93_ZPchr0014g46662 [Zizania palustris]KAG8082995.1 hypothetical protein GUJ93_ZPchr0014g47659 [Zizania palustris]
MHVHLPDYGPAQARASRSSSHYLDENPNRLRRLTYVRSIHTASDSSSRLLLLTSELDQLAMIPVGVAAGLLEEYTVRVARVLARLFNVAPFPRRVRFLMLRSLPFVPPPPPPPPPAHALRVATRG